MSDPSSQPTQPLTDAEQTKLERDIAFLRESGYAELSEYEGLKVGTRVRAAAHQFPRALREGTGSIAAIGRKSGSAWTSDGEVEVVVVFDKDVMGAWSSRVHQLGSYHVEAVCPALGLDQDGRGQANGNA